MEKASRSQPVVENDDDLEQNTKNGRSIPDLQPIPNRTNVDEQESLSALNIMKSIFAHNVSIETHKVCIDEPSYVW